MGEENLANVGDVIKIITFIGNDWFPVTRVTKTLAISKFPDGYEFKFKRLIGNNMSHPHNPSPIEFYHVIKYMKDMPHPYACSPDGESKG